MALARGVCSYLALTYVNQQRRRSEDALRLSEDRLRLLTDNIPGAVYQRQSGTGGIVSYLSSGIEPLIGHPPAVLVGPAALRWSDLIHPEDRETVEGALGAIPAGQEYTLDYRLRHADGRDVWIQDRGRATLGADGSRRFDGVLLNITEQRLAEKAAKETSSLQAAILGNAAYAVIATTAEGVITFFNRAAERMLGYTSIELVGKQTPAIFHDSQEVAERAEWLSGEFEHDISPGFEVFVAEARYDKSSEKEWTYIRKDGTTFPVLLSVTAIKAPDGSISGFLGIASDVTERKTMSKRLRKLEEISSRILLQSPDAILLTSLADGRIMEANPGFEKITGIKRSDALWHTTIDLDIWHDLTERLAMIDAIKNSGEIVSMPIRINQRGGSVRHCAMWARSFTMDGEALILSVVHDVTDLRLAIEAAHESEQMLQTVLDSIPSRVFWKDLNSVYLGSNRNFAIDAGVDDPAAIVGKSDLDLVWQDQAAAFIAMDRQVTTTLTPVIDDVVPFLDGSGQRRWMKLSKVPIVTRSGEVKGVLGVQDDMTDQIEAQQLLRSSEEKLRSLFETAPLGVTLTTVDGQFLEVNQAFLRITGYEPNELPDLNYRKLTAPEYADQDQRHVEILATTGRYGPYEKEYVRKDGTRIAVSLNGSMITGSDGARYVWSTVEDITLRRAAEAAQKQLNDELERLVTERTAELKSAMENLMRAEKLASLGSLVAGVAHEISTPVGNASLATSTMIASIDEFENLARDKLTRTALDAFIRQVKLGTDIANRNIERVAGLIQSFKQVAVDQTSSQRRQFQLTEIVDEIVTTMHPSLKRSGVKVDISVDAAITLDSYPGPLGQILTNLINNCLLHAFKADKSGTIRISAAQVDGTRVCLEVADNGAGIPATVLGRIFDPFFTSRLGQGGSGLGLHIVHNLVADILGGSIAVTSEIGKGTTFSIQLPRTAPLSSINES
ncbi:MAG: PAS domain S-box protein [Rhodospirillaceae bacterium]|nr:PAS domain S-box protein [Rhodospirillaceae bacterium]